MNKKNPNFIIKIFRQLLSFKNYIYVRLHKNKNIDLKETFTQIFETNSWGSKESISGPGSEYNSTKNIRKFIPKVIKDYNIKTFIDAPCGDVNWINPDALGVNYIGCDIVEELIQNNTKKISSQRATFIHLDITKDTLPKGDIILCRECLQHLSHKNILSFIENLKKSDIKYLLTTTYDSVKNEEILNGGFFHINLEKPPFNFPKEVHRIEEEVLENGYKKYLSLYLVKSL